GRGLRSRAGPRRRDRGHPPPAARGVERCRMNAPAVREAFRDRAHGICERKKEAAMRHIAMFLAAALVAAVSATVVAAGDDDDERELSDADLQAAKVSLEEALAAIEAQGTPISAKFEVEKGKLH